MKYVIDIIPGTSEFVAEELKEKFSSILITKIQNKKIYIEANFEDINLFRSLLSPLYISNEKGLKINLFRREWKKHHVPAGLNPSLAYILCRIADIKNNDIVLDPFCGGGTIAVSAALYFSPKKVLAYDISSKAVEYTARNFKAAKVNKFKYLVYRTDIARLKLAENSVTKVITNLPFGVRVGDHDANIRSYKHLAEKLKRVVAPKGIIILYSQEKKLISNIFNTSDFTHVKRFSVETGGLMPEVFVYKRV